MSRLPQRTAEDRAALAAWAIMFPGAAAHVSPHVSILLGVILHNLLGYLPGYVVTRLFGFDSRVARTVSVEVGMQNSGLAATLARGYFTPEMALPAVIFRCGTTSRAPSCRCSTAAQPSGLARPPGGPARIARRAPPRLAAQRWSMRLSRYWP